uniref:Myelin protein zero like 2 n=1 Tax=Amazona collaria TaxID=241587 RepID=A0A8B9F7V1_9PSIT
MDANSLESSTVWLAYQLKKSLKHRDLLDSAYAGSSPSVIVSVSMEVHTSKEVNAVNGTNLRLKCTFSSSSPISQHLSVTWNFRPEDLGSHELVMFWNDKRVTWDGNIERNDVSIMIWNLQPTDNGTFTCQVKNPPDANGVVGEVRLRVVQKGERPRTPRGHVNLARIPPFVIICRHHRKKAQEKRIEVTGTEL